MRSAISRASSAVNTSPSDPGITGTPALIICLRALILSPIKSMTLAEGPINLMPTSSHMVANFEFSLKNPKPGWIASAPVKTAADKTALIFK